MNILFGAFQRNSNRIKGHLIRKPNWERKTSYFDKLFWRHLLQWLILIEVFFITKVIFDWWFSFQSLEYKIVLRYIKINIFYFEFLFIQNRKSATHFRIASFKLRVLIWPLNGFFTQKCARCCWMCMSDFHLFLNWFCW